MAKGPENTDGLNHYSEKGGHRARGEESRTRRAFEQTFNGLPFFSADQQR